MDGVADSSCDTPLPPGNATISPIHMGIVLLEPGVTQSVERGVL